MIFITVRAVVPGNFAAKLQSLSHVILFYELSSGLLCRKVKFGQTNPSSVTFNRHGNSHVTSTLASWIWSDFSFNPGPVYGAFYVHPLIIHLFTVVVNELLLSPRLSTYLVVLALARSTLYASFGTELSEIKVVEVKRCFIHSNSEQKLVLPLTANICSVLIFIAHFWVGR